MTTPQPLSVFQRFIESAAYNLDALPDAPDDVSGMDSEPVSDTPSQEPTIPPALPADELPEHDVSDKIIEFTDWPDQAARLTIDRNTRKKHLFIMGLPEARQYWMPLWTGLAVYHLLAMVEQLETLIEDALALGHDARQIAFLAGCYVNAFYDIEWDPEDDDVDDES